MDWTVTDEDGNIIGTIPHEVAKEVLIQAIEEHEKRKHGHWIEDGYFELPCVCSYCGHEAVTDYDGEYLRTPYCPFCGAKMGVTE